MLNIDYYNYVLTDIIANLNLDVTLHLNREDFSGLTQRTALEKLSYVIDTIEHAIYPQLTNELLQEHILLQKYCEQLQELDALHRIHIHELVKRDAYWAAAAEFNYKNNMINYAYIQGHLFHLMNHLYPISLYLSENISFSKKNKIINLYSLLFKIASRPLGIKLILNLSNLLIENNHYKILLEFNAGFNWTIKPIEFFQRNENLVALRDEKGYRDKENPYIQAYQIILYVPHQADVIEIENCYVTDFSPATYIQRSYLILPNFLKLATALIGCLHYFRGKNRSECSFLKSDAIFKQFMGDVETYWTVAGGKLNETALAREHGLPVWRCASLQQ